MTIKRILVLANSTKHHPRSCVAGRELVDDENGGSRLGGWIRPVSDHDEGALDLAERRLANAQDPRPLDIIQVSLSKPGNNLLQPENWLIQAGQSWTKVDSNDAPHWPSLIEKPEDLWFDPSQKIDRAGETFLLRRPNFQSLYLIRPDAFYFQIRSKVWDGYAKKQLRGIFTCCGRHYDFPLTDPLIGRKYYPDFPKTKDGNIQPEDSRKIFLCVSLTPPFHDLHYKVIATVFEVAP
jgi:hypothetical protein